MPKKVKKTLAEVVELCKYQDWDIVYKDNDGHPYLQVQFDAQDCITGVPERQYCRKWQLSYHMCETEVVRTAYKAVEAAVIHEAQEFFKFGGEPVFRPHFDVWALFNLSQNNRVEKRKPLSKDSTLT